VQLHARVGSQVDIGRAAIDVRFGVKNRLEGNDRFWPRKADIGHNADVRKVPATDIPRARPTVARCFLRGTKPGWNEDAGLCYHLAIVDLVRSQGERRGPME